jgi:hypothetical protein
VPKQISYIYTDTDADTDADADTEVSCVCVRAHAHTHTHMTTVDATRFLTTFLLSVVLIVGDGNLSFSLAMARAFPKMRLIATTYDSETFVLDRWQFLKASLRLNIMHELTTALTFEKFPLDMVHATSLPNSKIEVPPPPPHPTSRMHSHIPTSSPSRCLHSCSTGRARDMG